MKIYPKGINFVLEGDNFQYNKVFIEEWVLGEVYPFYTVEILSNGWVKVFGKPCYISYFEELAASYIPNLDYALINMREYEEFQKEIEKRDWNSNTDKNFEIIRRTLLNQ